MEAEGVKVIWPLVEALQPPVRAVPSTVTPVIAPLQVAFSAKVTLKASSTVALPAAERAGPSGKAAACRVFAPPAVVDPDFVPEEKVTSLVVRALTFSVTPPVGEAAISELMKR